MACASSSNDGLSIDPTFFWKSRQMDFRLSIEVMNSIRWWFDGKVDIKLTKHAKARWPVLVP